jgi:hypothetical protein
VFVCCDCCVFSGRGLCDGFITRPEESYRLWRVIVCDQETSKTRRLMPATGLWKIQLQWVVTPRKQINKQLPTNAQLIYRLSHSSYVFRHYCFILRKFVVSNLLSYTSMSNAAVGNAV